MTSSSVPFVSVPINQGQVHQKFQKDHSHYQRLDTFDLRHISRILKRKSAYEKVYSSFDFNCSSNSFLCPGLSAGRRCNNVSKERVHKKKNKKVNVPSSWEAEYLPLKNLFPKRQREEKDLYWEGAYVYTEGYMTSAEEQGPESCNCKQASKSQKDGDVHMYLSSVKDAPKKNSMVVEITPVFKKKYPDYKQYMKKNIKIRVFGFLFYDIEHEDSAFTTCNSCGHIWRKTNWEIHPITKIEIVEEE